MKKLYLWIILVVVCVLASVFNAYLCDLVWVEWHKVREDRIPEIIIYER